MARPTKLTVEYYPHYCKHGKTIKILEAQWGNDGYAVFYKLYDALGDSPGHYFDVRRPDNWNFLVSVCGVNDEILQEILDKLAILGVIDQELWSSRVLWSDAFIDSIRDAYRKRKIPCPEKPHFVSDAGNGVSGAGNENPGVGVSGVHNPQGSVVSGVHNPQGSVVSGVHNPQSKVYNNNPLYPPLVSGAGNSARSKPHGGDNGKKKKSSTLIKELQSHARACYQKCSGTCAGTWNDSPTVGKGHKDQPDKPCHWCQKFHEQRSAHKPEQNKGQGEYEETAIEK